MKKTRTTLTPHFKRKYEDLVDNNCHSEVVYQVAKDFGVTTIQEKAKEIVDKHNELGYITLELIEERSKLTESLMEQLKSQLDEKSYKNLSDIL